MSVTRINEFLAKPGQEPALHEFLVSVVETIIGSSGCVSCQLLSSQENPARFVVIEVWQSVEAHKGAARAIPADQIQRVMGLLAASPKGEYFT